LDVQVQEKNALAVQKEALEKEKSALSEQVKSLASKLQASTAPCLPYQPITALVTPPSPLESAVVQAAQAAVFANEEKPKRITSSSIIGVSDMVQAALESLQLTLQDTCKCLAMPNTTDTAVLETRKLCLLLRRRLVKTVGSQAVDMEAVLVRVLEWSKESQVRNTFLQL
jgi:hypothetical protein